MRRRSPNAARADPGRRGRAAIRHTNSIRSWPRFLCSIKTPKMPHSMGQKRFAQGSQVFWENWRVFANYWKPVIPQVLKAKSDQQTNRQRGPRHANSALPPAEGVQHVEEGGCNVRLHLLRCRAGYWGGCGPDSQAPLSLFGALIFFKNGRNLQAPSISTLNRSLLNDGTRRKRFHTVHARPRSSSAAHPASRSQPHVGIFETCLSGGQSEDCGVSTTTF